MLLWRAQLEIRIHQLSARTFLSLDDAEEEVDVALRRTPPLYIAGLLGAGGADAAPTEKCRRWLMNPGNGSGGAAAVDSTRLRTFVPATDPRELLKELPTV